MSLIEQKINTIARMLLSQDEASREQAREELEQLIRAPETQPEPDCTALIHQLLAEIGVPSGLSGHAYLADSISAAVNDPLVLDGITKPGGLYEAIGARYGKSPTITERGIRNCIETAWMKGDSEAQAKYFGTTLKSKTLFPSNRNFISRMANIVRLQTKRR